MKKKLLNNILHLLFSTAFTRALNMILILILAKFFESEYYGMFSLAIALSMILGYFTDAGLNNIAIRECSKQSRDTAHVFSNYVKVRVALLIFTLLSTVIFVENFYKDSELQNIIYLIVIPMVIGLSMQSVSITFFQFQQDMGKISKIRSLSAVVQVILVFIGITLDGNVFIICFLYGISYLVAGIYGIVLFLKNINFSFKYKWDSSMFSGAIPFILSGMIMILIPQMGPIILERTLSFEQLGLYSLAYRIPAALYAIPGVVAGAFYPILFKMYNKGEQLHLKTNLKQIKIMSCMGLLVTIILFFASSDIIHLFFGPDWDNAVQILKITSLIVFLQGISVPIADGLSTSNLQHRRTAVQFSTLVFGVFVYYILSLELGVIGAAYAVVLIEIIQLLFLTVVNKNRWIILKKVLVIYFFIPILIILLTNYYFSGGSILSIIVSIAITMIVWLVADSEVSLKKVLRYKKYLQ